MLKKCVILALAIITWSMAAEYPMVKVGGFFAGQFFYDQSEAISYNNSFKLGYLRFQIIGDITEKINGFIQIENKTGVSTLQNAFLNYIPFAKSEIRFGYIKLPFGIEAYGHPLQSPTIAISKASQSIYRGAQDMGIHFFYEQGLAKGYISIVNGNSGALNDNNNFKDIGGKLILKPIPGLAAGGSFYAGKKDTNELSTNRYGAEIDYKQSRIWLRGELLGALDEQSAGGDLKSLGYYATIALKILPQIECAFRYDWFDPNTDIADNEWTNFTLGVAYYLATSGWNRIAINYEIRDDKADQNLDNLFTAQVQILY